MSVSILRFAPLGVLLLLAAAAPALGQSQVVSRTVPELLPSAGFGSKVAMGAGSQPLPCRLLRRTTSDP